MALFWRRYRKKRLRTKKKERSILWHLFIGILVMLFVAGVCYGVWYLTRLPQVTITEVIAEGGETISHEEVIALVERELVGDYFLLVPRRFSYTYPKKMIIKKVSAVPRIHNVRAILEDRKRLKISFDEYSPYALWCENREETAPCNFISESGYSFAAAPLLRGSSFLRHIIEGKPPEIYVNTLSEETMRRIDTFVNALKEQFGFRVRQIVHTVDGDEEYHLQGGSTLLVSAEKSVQETFDNLHSILESEEFVHLKTEPFNYIDLRFGDRVFVKEEFPPTEEEATTTASTTE